MKRAFLLPSILLLEVILFLAAGSPSQNSISELSRYAHNFLSEVLAQSVPLLLLACGMTIIMMAGGIDLSPAAALVLVAAVMGEFSGGSAFWYTAIPVGLLVALLLGLFNGALVGFLGIPPIIATLGTMIFFRGLCFVVLGDDETEVFISVPGYDHLGSVKGASFIFLPTILLFLGWLRFSAWRLELLTIGGNPVASLYAGIRVERRWLQAYLVMGVFYFLAAVSFTARNSAVSASSLAGLELQVIVAVILGGTSVQGGRGSLIGTIWGVLIIAVLEEGLREAAVWGQSYFSFKISHLRYLVLGALLVFAVWLNQRSETGLKRMV